MRFKLTLSTFLAFAPLLAQTPPSGTISGTIFDGSNGTPIRQAVVENVGAPARHVVTDLDGKYTMTLSPGTYVLRITAPKYLAATLDKVEVKNGEMTEASTVMVSASAVTTMEVSETVGAVAATAEAALQERRLSAVVSDGLSGEEIRKAVASDAAGAVSRVTGVSIVENGYVYVRGLGERYSSTMLNNAVIPTTEPEKRVVPLDLFPSSLIDSIKIIKSYTPDMPGEFSGGVVQMSTIDFPTAKVLRFTATTGYNTATTGKRFMSYPGGSKDAFGFDDGARALPGAIPEGRLIGGNFTPQELQQYGRSFENNWEPSVTSSMRPQQTYSVVGGNTFGRFGLVGALTFANRPVPPRSR